MEIQAKENSTQEIVRFAAETQFDDFPDEVVHETKRILLDSIGCVIAGLSVEKDKLSRVLLNSKIDRTVKSTLDLENVERVLELMSYVVL